MDKITIFKDTMETLTRGFYPSATHLVYLKLSAPERKRAVVLFPEDVKSICEATDFDHIPTGKKCEITCENMDSYTMAIKRYEKSPHMFKNGSTVLVLNFANPVNPGGGVRYGAKAQEEDLCRRSSLLLSLETEEASEFYSFNKSVNPCLSSNSMIISPRVEIIKDEEGIGLEDTKIVSVLTCAAPMIEGLKDTTPEEYEKLFYERITGMLKCAVYLGYRNLVLGAFGCGAFGNDAHLVSNLFYNAIKDFEYDGMKAEDMFLSIDFAVRSRSSNQYNFKEFYRNFGDYYAQTENQEKKKDYIFFWKNNEENGYLSNWYDSRFIIDDFVYRHVEQYIMAQKAKLFHDAIRYTQILRADTPDQCKKLGKLVTSFDSALWQKNRYKILMNGLYAKFSQDEKLKKKLLSTGNSILAEASPNDSLLGIGLDEHTAKDTDESMWPGENILGKALMEVRELLKTMVAHSCDFSRE